MLSNTYFELVVILIALCVINFPGYFKKATNNICKKCNHFSGHSIKRCINFFLFWFFTRMMLWKQTKNSKHTIENKLYHLVSKNLPHQWFAGVWAQTATAVVLTHYIPVFLKCCSVLANHWATFFHGGHLGHLKIKEKTMSYNMIHFKVFSENTKFQSETLCDQWVYMCTAQLYLTQ